MLLAQAEKNKKKHFHFNRQNVEKYPNKGQTKAGQPNANPSSIQPLQGISQAKQAHSPVNKANRGNPLVTNGQSNIRKQPTTLQSRNNIIGESPPKQKPPSEFSISLKKQIVLDPKQVSPHNHSGDISHQTSQKNLESPTGERQPLKQQTSIKEQYGSRNDL